MVAMVFFDEETEEICQELGYDLILPSDALRRRLDSKIVTTQLGNEAGAPSVPNVLGHVDTGGADDARRPDTASARTSSCRRRTATPARPRSSSSPRTTGTQYADDIVGEQLKVMKRIDNKAAAVEACITRHGTIVGPFMTDLTGYPS